MFGFQGFGQDGAHDEGAEGGRETGLGGHDHHHETQAQGCHQQGLVAHQLAGLSEDDGNEVKAHHQPQDKEEEQLEEAHHQFSAFKVGRYGHRGQNHHENHGQNVFQDEDAHHQAGEILLGEAQVFKGLVDDGGGTHADHPSQEEGVHLSPAEGRTYQVPQHHHSEDDGEGGDDGRAARLHDFLEAELQAQGKEQEDDADIRPHVDAGGVNHRRGEGKMGTGDESGDDVAQHKRLFELLEDERHDTGADENQRQVCNEWG